MGMEGFSFGIPAMITTQLTIFVGGIFVLVGWAEVLSNGLANGYWKIPVALYVFTGSVGVELMGSIVLSEISPTESFQTVTLIWIAFLIASFILLLLSAVLAHQNSEPNKRTVQIGSKVLLAIATLGFIGIILGLPGMPLHGG
jgi:hypothetical protein